MLPRLERDFAGLTARRERFEAESRALSDAQLRFRPAQSAWSIAEVAHHLLQVESAVTRAATKPGVQRRGRRRTPREWLKTRAFHSIVTLDLRIRVPREVAGFVTPAAEPDAELLWSEWKSVHADLAGYLETVSEQDVGDMAFRHPIMGPTKVRELLPFLRKHFDHHMRQVRRIRAAPGFPSTLEAT